MKQNVTIKSFVREDSVMKRTKGWIRLDMATPPRLDLHILFPQKYMKNQYGEYDNARNRRIRDQAVKIRDRIVAMLAKYEIKLKEEE